MLRSRAHLLGTVELRGEAHGIVVSVLITPLLSILLLVLRLYYLLGARSGNHVRLVLLVRVHVVQYDVVGVHRGWLSPTIRALPAWALHIYDQFGFVERVLLSHCFLTLPRLLLPPPRSPCLACLRCSFLMLRLVIK